MKDARERAGRLRREAEECRLISKLATNLEKRETFARLAEGHDRQADELEALIARAICKTCNSRSRKNNCN